VIDEGEQQSELMKRPSGKRLLLPLLAISLMLRAQSPEERAAGFKLTVSVLEGPGKEFPDSIQVLIVKLTNISNMVIREDACSAFGGLYKLLVVRDGVQIEEKDEIRKEREARETEEAKGGMFCVGSVRSRALKPGDSWDDRIYYDPVAPGRYEFTVEERAFPRGPEESVTVRSNSVTVIVPDPKAQKAE
jgi:hypothetical protein